MKKIILCLMIVINIPIIISAYTGDINTLLNELIRANRLEVDGKNIESKNLHESITRKLVQYFGKSAVLFDSKGIKPLNIKITQSCPVVLTGRSKDTYYFMFDCLSPAFNLYAYNTLNKSSTESGNVLPDEESQKIENASLGTRFIADMTILNVFSSDKFGTIQEYPEGTAFYIQSKLSNLKKLDITKPRLFDYVLFQNALNVYEDLQKEKYEKKRYISAKNLELQAIDIMEKLRSRGIMYCDDELNLYKTGENTDKNHLWMDINYPSRVKVYFHGDYDTKFFDYEEKVPLAFIIESYKLDKNDDDEVFLSIEIKFISNIDKSVETAIHQFEEEGRYLGELKNGIPHGRGIFLYDHYTRYAGDFVDGKFNGEGIYVFSDNHRYTGKWKDGLKHGEGTYIWTGGSRYSGSWENDLMNGRGTYTESDGRSWTGQWSNDKPLNAPQWLKEIFSDEEE